MKRLFSITASVIMISLLFNVAFARAVKKSGVIYTDPNKPIIITSAHPWFNVTLKSNRTTGYSWFVTRYPTRFIRITKHKYIAPSSKLMGAPGQEVWTFKANALFFKAPHHTRIKLLYAQPWERQEGQSIELHIFSK